MAQFLWSRVAPFLVLAVACFSCCAAATTTNMTTAKKTTAPTTASLTTLNTTTAPPTTNIMTTGNMTTAPSNLTTAPSNMTTAPSNMTTAPSNMTTAPSNMTTAPSNMTTAPSNMTTTPSNMTTAPSNMTTASSNMTTAPSNMTTMPSNMSTTQPAMTTTSPDVKWTVRDKNKKLCMMMGFDGTITYKNVTHPIPPSASIVKSNCNSSSFSLFVLEFSDGEINLWQLILNFTMSKDTFRLSKVMINLYVDAELKVDGTVQENFQVPVGDYYKCAYLNMSASPFMVNLTDPVFQPFVQKTKGGDNLGEEYLCNSGSSTSYTNIIIEVIVGILILAAAVGLTYYVVKRRGRSSDPPYARVQ